MRSSIESALPHVYIVNPPFTKLTGFSTNVSKKLLSPLVLPVAFVDILSTNVYATATIFGGGVSHFSQVRSTYLRCGFQGMRGRHWEAVGLFKLYQAIATTPLLAIWTDPYG
jgi:hypothetical protein